MQNGSTLTLTGDITEAEAGMSPYFRAGDNPADVITIAGTCSWTGPTRVYSNGGSLAIAGNDKLPTTVDLIVGASAGTTGSPTFDLAGFSQAVQQQFWGKARYADSSPVLPADEAERQRLPVSPAVARQVMDVGELSGLAEWCDLDWQGHYLTLTTSARRHGFTEKQLAFIGVTHGALQGFMARAMQQRSCEDEQRQRVAQLLRQSPNRSFP